MKERVVIQLGESAITVAMLRLERQGPAVLRRHRIGLDSPLIYDDLDVDAVSKQIVEGVRTIDGVGKRTTILIPAHWCYTHALRLSRKRVQDPTLAYQLEEYLPATLEDLTCTFLRNGSAQALGLALRTEPMRQLLAHLTAANILVEKITPDICCAAVAEQPAKNGGDHGLLIRDGRRRTMAFLGDHDPHPALVRTIFDGLAVENHELAEQLSISEAAAGVRTTCWSTWDMADTRACNEMMLSSLNEQLPNLACGALSPYRRTAKTLGLAKTTGMLLSLFLISLLLNLFVQHRAYSKALAGVQSARQELYRGVFPGASLAPHPALRMASERKRLEGMTLQAGNEREVAEVGTADRLRPLDVLRDVALFLPTEVRIKLDNLTIDPHQLLLRGQTRDHGDAERIVEAIEQVEGLTAKPPKTSRLSNGAVEFSVRAILADPSPQKVIDEQTNVAAKLGSK